MTTPPINPASPNERLNRISEDAMCVGCGLCQSIAGPDIVRMELVENGTERPVARGPLTHETVHVIYDTCPGTRVEGLPQDEIDSTSCHDLIWGPYQSMHLAYASDPQIRHQGSTGGVLTALATYLDESGEDDFILHAKAATRNPT
ncbi:MAG: hydrogenase, partial [Alphaproteobacteria bacterium]|nr:hydrogenase [Alphaproteobacteria bacterium]